MAAPKPVSMTSTQAQSTLPADLRNEIYSALLSGGGIRNIEAALDHEMQTAGFKSQLKAYITHLLRAGECTTFDEVMARVNEKIRHDTQAGKSNGTNGVNGVNGHSRDDDYDLRLPERVVSEGTKTVEAELDKVCDITVDK
ncbi:hypothetical protein K458DRAFT_309477 [Lentithecium fluviatile CBS 122367]|uniref:Uncharacterized protein n=1 Tax=Lentithecium fluviatile CBS 122367 TaxID=1168545 RepID=A0A6G1IUI0_9PLEO|nr:hypothetical protein K458DRAFT_309477 [Lentithecium fluviatile CBS 122367]